MTYTSETRGDIAILKFSGRLVFEESLFTLRGKIRELLHSGVKAFVFDFSGVPHCDSSGCGEMISAYTTIRKADAALAFVQLTPRVLMLWERVRLTDVFDIFKTLTEAESFVRR